MYKGVGAGFADFISFFFNIPGKRNNLVSLRPNYFISIEYLKVGAGRDLPLKPLLSTGSTQIDPSRHNWTNIDWDVKNQINQINCSITGRHGGFLLCPSV